MERNNQIIIHVGFHKTGSTFLRNYFMKHPKVTCLQEEFTDFADDVKKEIDLSFLVIQNKFFITNMRLTVNSWGQTTYQRVHKNSFLKEEIRNNQQEIAVKLKEYFPQAKILITTRQIDNLKKSLYSQYILNGGTQSYSTFNTHGSYIEELFDFDYVEKLYTDIFGKSNVVVIPYEKLKVEPDLFLKDVCNLLNVPFVRQEIKKINPSLHKWKMKQMRITNILIYFLLIFVSKSKKESYFKSYIERNIKNHSKND